MIKTFGNKETEKIFNQFFSKKLPHSIQKTALRKLMMIGQSENLNDLRIPPDLSAGLPARIEEKIWSEKSSRPFQWV